MMFAGPKFLSSQTNIPSQPPFTSPAVATEEKQRAEVDKEIECFF
jgi:hypothetical protein